VGYCGRRFIVETMNDTIYEQYTIGQLVRAVSKRPTKPILAHSDLNIMLHTSAIGNEIIYNNDIGMIVSIPHVGINNYHTCIYGILFNKKIVYLPHRMIENVY
jgi:hypothetical protein